MSAPRPAPVPVAEAAPAPVADPMANPGLAASALARLREEGFCVLSRLLEPAVIAELDAQVAERLRDTPFGEGGFYGTRTKRFGRMLARTPDARRLAQHPVILAVAEALLAPYCDTIQLNVMQAIEIHPGEIAQVPHRDQDMWHGPKGGHEYLLNVMWPLTPFSRENGATVIWPGSHGVRALDPAEPGEGMPARAEPGDAILFLGSTLHGAGANHAALPRRGVVVGYSLGWLKPYENLWLAYPPEIARGFGPELAALAGYRQHRPNLGNIDGQCPSRLLTGDLPDHAAAIDALTPKQEAMVASHVARERARGAAPRQ